LLDTQVRSILRDDRAAEFVSDTHGNGIGAQALVILMSPAVALARQPEMVGEPAKA
jgi:hypothetical protein